MNAYFLIAVNRERNNLFPVNRDSLIAINRMASKSEIVEPVICVFPREVQPRSQGLSTSRKKRDPGNEVAQSFKDVSGQNLLDVSKAERRGNLVCVEVLVI